MCRFVWFTSRRGRAVIGVGVCLYGGKLSCSVKGLAGAAVSYQPNPYVYIFLVLGSLKLTNHQDLTDLQVICYDCR